MGFDNGEERAVALPSPNDLKVHRLMLIELLGLVGKTITLFPAIEAARPGCSSGREALCSLRTAIDNAKSFLQYCSQSSKLYLALTSDSILERCKRSRNALERSLFQIQNLVPVILAAEISSIISDLKRINFAINSSEEAAGKIVRAFLQQSASNRDSNEIEKSAIETMHIVSMSLQITSPKDLATERGSIKRLLDHVSDREPGKKQILVYLLNLLKNYAQLITTEQDNGSLNSEEPFPSTYFSDNSLTSFTSLSTLNDLYLPADTESQRTQSCASNNEMDQELLLLANLDELPSWDFQCQVVGDLKSHLKQDFRSSNNYVRQVLSFMKHAYHLSDWEAMRNGARLFMSFLRTNNSSLNFHEDAYGLLPSLLSSDLIEEGLSITEVLSSSETGTVTGTVTPIVGSILKIIEAETSKFQDQAIRILYNLSFHTHIPSEIIPKLLPFSEDPKLTRFSMGILKNISNQEDSLVSIAETNGCISFIAESLQFHDQEVQENASFILLTLCSCRFEYRQLVMNEGVIPGLVNISNNGSEKGKTFATELLRLLRDTERSDCSGNGTRVEAKYSPIRDNNMEKKPSGNTIFGIFSKHKKEKKKKKK